jgi:hypothetical protein
MSVLQGETELMDHIVSFNKLKGVDFDDFEMKKMNIDTAIKVYHIDLEFRV